MAAVATVTSTERIGPSTKLVFGTLALDSAYPNTEGGYDLTPSDFKGRKILNIHTSQIGYLGDYVAASSQLKICDLTTGAESTNDADLSVVTAMPFVAWVQAPW